MESLNQAEAREIKEQTEKSCAAIRAGMAESTSTEEKVKKLCNATARCFKTHSDWPGASDRLIAGIKQCVTDEWHKLVQETSLSQLKGLRLEMAKRPIQTLNDTDMQKKYWVYVSETLPLK